MIANNKWEQSKTLSLVSNNTLKPLSTWEVWRKYLYWKESYDNFFWKMNFPDWIFQLLLVTNYFDYEARDENQWNLEGSRYKVEASFLNFFEVPTWLIWGEGMWRFCPRLVPWWWESVQRFCPTQHEQDCERWLSHIFWYTYITI